MVERVLSLQPGELRKLLPFFGLYSLLFLAITLADGLSLVLFVQQVGAARLPACYAASAVANLLCIGAYLWWVHRTGSVGIFQAILICSGVWFFAAWLGYHWLGGNYWFGMLFLGREVCYTLVLMHFGTLLQDYFSREQLDRMLPVIYAGGRAGGIAGGWVLATASSYIAPVHLVLLFLAMIATGMIGLDAVRRYYPRRATLFVPISDLPHASDVRPVQDDHPAARSIGAFVRYLWESPFLFWTAVTGVLFILCRWLLNFQYSTFFEQHFADEVAMAQFVGRYTQIALALSLALQLLLVSRLVSWIGLRGTHYLYAGLLLAGLGANALGMTLATAVYSRLVENELRFGLRNPIAQLMINRFSRGLRIAVRAWTLGVIIPVATLAASGLLMLLQGFGAATIALAGALAGVLYCAASWGMCSAFAQHESPDQIACSAPSQDQAAAAGSSDDARSRRAA